MAAATEEIRLLVDRLSSPELYVAEKACEAIGNFVNGDRVTLDVILAADGIQPLLELTKKEISVEFLRTLAWTFSRLCRQKESPHLPIEMIQVILPYITNLLHNPDQTVVRYSLRALCHMSDGPDEHIQLVIETGLLPLIIDSLKSEDKAIVAPALATLVNMVAGTDMQSQEVINAGILGEHLIQLMKSGQERRTKESWMPIWTCWLLGNILVRNSEQIKSVVDANLIPEIINCLDRGESETQYEAAWAICNMSARGSPEQIVWLAASGVIKPICNLLGANDPKIVNVLLDTLNNLLENSLRLGHLNEVDVMIEECGGLDKLESLQQHEDENIYQQSLYIIEKYFSEADKEAEQQYEGEWCCVAHVLMESKRQECYTAVFQTLKTSAEKLANAPLKLKVILTDFEDAEMNGASTVFGADKVKGCLFHYTQALLRNVKKYNLWPFYTRFGEGNAIHTWLRQLCALPLLPTWCVKFVWEYLLIRVPQPPKSDIDWVPPPGFPKEWPTKQLENFATYFNREWISKLEADQWNHWESGADRTTNAAEAYHSQLSRRSSVPNRPLLGAYLRKLSERHTEASTRVDQLKHGHPPRPRAKKYVELNVTLDRYKKGFKEALDNCAGDRVKITDECISYLNRCKYLLSDCDDQGKTLKTKKSDKEFQELYGDIITSTDSPARNAAKKLSVKAKKTKTRTVLPPKKNRTVAAVSDYDAMEEYELSFKIGENITVLDDRTWWKGSLHSGEGYFPSKLVALETHTQDERTVRALSDFNGANAKELSFKEGDIIDILDDAARWKGSHQGLEGMFFVDSVQVPQRPLPKGLKWGGKLSTNTCTIDNLLTALWCAVSEDPSLLAKFGTSEPETVLKTVLESLLRGKTKSDFDAAREQWILYMDQNLIQRGRNPIPTTKTGRLRNLNGSQLDFFLEPFEPVYGIGENIRCLGCDEITPVRNIGHVALARGADDIEGEIEERLSFADVWDHGDCGVCGGVRVVQCSGLVAPNPWCFVLNSGTIPASSYSSFPLSISVSNHNFHILAITLFHNEPPHFNAILRLRNAWYIYDGLSTPHLCPLEARHIARAAYVSYVLYIKKQ